MVVGDQLSTFDGKSKSAKIPKSHLELRTNFQKSTSNFPELKFPFRGGGRGGVGCDWNAWYLVLTSSVHLGFGVNYKILTRILSTQTERVHHRRETNK